MGVTALALAVRVGYVLGTEPRHLPFSDSVWYQFQANFLAKGHGFVDPLVLAFTGRSVASASHPPLFPLILAAGSFLGATSVEAHQLMGCLIGVGTVIGVGLVAKEIAGERAGLLAATLAAVYPPLWLNDGGLMAESLFAVVITLVMLASYRFIGKPTPKAAALLGITIGLAMLTRAEAVLLIVVLVLPVVLRAKQLPSGRRLGLASLAVIAAAVTTSPWVIRNLVTFERPVTLSTGDGTLAGANCAATYYGSQTGLWTNASSCYPPALPGDESVANVAERHQGLAYAYHHLSRVPIVVAVRIGRVWEVYAPLQDASVDGDDGRPAWGNRLGLAAYAAVVPAAAVGVVILRRPRVSLVPLAAQFALVTLTATLVWGGIRFRSPADVVLVILAGVALDGSRRLATLTRRVSSPVREQ